MPSPIQGPQFQAQTRTQPWQALPVTYPASTQTASPPAAGGVVTTISDDFNRADSSSLGNTSVGSVPWTNLIGVNGISSNRAANVSYSADGLASRAISYIDKGSADGTIEATLHVSGTTGHFTPCVAFRIQDDKHFWLLGAAGLEIVSFSGGTLQFTSVISPGYVDGDVAKVVLSGSTITAYKNGSVIGTGPITDSTYATATKHGIYFEDEGAGITQSLDDWSYGYTPVPVSRGWVVGAIGWGAPAVPPSFVDSSSAVTSPSSVTSINVTVPAATQVGDVIAIAAAMHDVPLTFDTPTGYALVQDAGDNVSRLTAWYKIAASGDPGSTVTVSITGGGVEWPAVLCLVYRNVDQTTPLFMSANGSSGSTSPWAAPAVSAGTKAAVGAYIWGTFRGATTYPLTFGSGRPRVDVVGTGREIAAADLDLAPGATDAITATPAAAQEYIAFSLVFQAP